MLSDRNLLFGILAVQLRGLSPQSLVEAGAVWAVSPTKPISEILRERGHIDERDCRVLDKLVEDVLEAADGNMDAAISGVGGDGSISQVLQGRSSPDVTEAFATQRGDSIPPVTVQSGSFATYEETPGRYQGDREFSRGGMGRILLVHDGFLEREVALKELLPLAKDNDATLMPDSASYASSVVVARFLREARITAQLEHPGIVPIYEVGRRSNGVLYYTMRLVRGKTLSQAIAFATDLKTRLRLMKNFLDLCQAISYAHSRGVIHRDIKPSNVLIGAFGETVVIDWGLAKIRGKEDPFADRLRDSISENSSVEDSGTLRTQHGARLGTPHYMSPEQADGSIESIDEGSDVFSLGTVLYEILTGQKAFTGKTVYDILSKVTRDEPTPIGDLVPDIDPELVVICEKAMRKRPSDRYGSAAELAEEITRYQTGAWVQAYDYSAGEVLRRYYRRHQAIVNTVAAGLLILLSLGVYSYVTIRQAYEREFEQRQVAESARDRAERNAYIAQLRTAEGHIDRLEYAEAREILWETAESLRDWEWGHLLLKVTNNRLEFRDAIQPVWNSNGSRLIFATRTDAPRVVDMDEPEKSFSPNAPDGERYGPMRISPNDKYLAAGTTAGTVVVWDASTGTLEFSIPVYPGGRSVGILEFSPDSKYIAIGRESQALVVNLETEELFATVPLPAGEFGIDLEFDPETLVLGVGYGSEGVRKGCVIFDLLTRTVRGTLSGSQLRMNPVEGRFGIVDSSQIIQYGLDLDPTASAIDVSGRVVDWLWEPTKGKQAVVTNGREVFVFDADTGRLLYSRVHSSARVNPIAGLAISKEGDRLAAFTSKGASVNVWDMETGVLVAAYEIPYANGLRGLVFRPGSREIATDSELATPNVVFIRPSDWSLDQTVEVYPYRGAGALRSDDAKKYVVWSSNLGEACVYNPADSTFYTVGSNPQLGIGQSVVSPDGKTILFAVDRCSWLVWDTENLTPRGVFSAHGAPVSACAISPNNLTAATTSIDGSLLIWDMASRTVLHSIRPERLIDQWGDLNVLFAPSGDRLFLAGREYGVQVWDPHSGRLIDRLYSGVKSDGSVWIDEDRPDVVMAFALPMGNMGWNMETGEPVSKLEGPSSMSRLSAPLLGRDLNRVATALPSGITVMESETRNRLTSLEFGDAGTANMAVWAPRDGSSIIAGSMNHRALLRLQTLPYDAWEEISASENSFDSWRTARLSAGDRPPPHRVLTSYWFTTPEDLARALAFWSDQVDGLGSRSPVRAPFGLTPEDTVISVGGVGTAEASVLLANDVPDRLEVVATRGGDEFTIHVIVLPVQELSESVRLTWSEAHNMLSKQQSMLDTIPDVLLRLSRESALQRGVRIIHDDDSLDGLVLPSPQNRKDEALYEMAKVFVRDRIVSIDGQPIDSVTTARRICTEFLSSLEGGKYVTVEYTVERDSFHRVTIQYEFESPQGAPEGR